MKIVRRDRVHASAAVSGKAAPGTGKLGARAAATGDRFDVWLTTSPGRLLAATGPTGSASLDRMVATAPSAPAPAAPEAFAAALEESKGADAFYYLDLAGLMTAIEPPPAAAPSKRKAGATPVPPIAPPVLPGVPLHAIVRTGPAAVLELRIPTTSVERIISFVRLVALAGAGGGPGLMDIAP